ncbi:hypothetical protein ACFSL4_13110 [Streptomyces caeni]|uniref:MmgE/PrpD C-terminal domain-containing protein n=1 Tax=Streptomyces caeni TaxID=2307231 RepID=A0ABW4IRB5_9ACTN
MRGRTRSLPCCAATALLEPAEYSDFDAERARDPQLRWPVERNDVREDSAMTQKFPSATPCRISVTLRDGEAVRRERDFSRGDPHGPPSDDDVSEDRLGTSAIRRPRRAAAQSSPACGTWRGPKTLACDACPPPVGVNHPHGLRRDLRVTERTRTRGHLGEAVPCRGAGRM